MLFNPLYHYVQILRAPLIGNGINWLSWAVVGADIEEHLGYSHSQYGALLALDVDFEEVRNRVVLSE